MLCLYIYDSARVASYELGMHRIFASYSLGRRIVVQIVYLYSDE